MDDVTVKPLTADEIAALERLYFKGCVIGEVQYDADAMLDLIRCVQALIKDKDGLCIIFKMALLADLPIIFKGGHILIVAND